MKRDLIKTKPKNKDHTQIILLNNIKMTLIFKHKYDNRQIFKQDDI